MAQIFEPCKHLRLEERRIDYDNTEYSCPDCGFWHDDATGVTLEEADRIRQQFLMSEIKEAA